MTFSMRTLIPQHWPVSSVKGVFPSSVTSLRKCLIKFKKTPKPVLVAWKFPIAESDHHGVRRIQNSEVKLAFSVSVFD